MSFPAFPFLYDFNIYIHQGDMPGSTSSSPAAVIAQSSTHQHNLTLAAWLQWRDSFPADQNMPLIAKMSEKVSCRLRQMPLNGVRRNIGRFELYQPA